MKQHPDSSSDSTKTVVRILIGSGELRLSRAARVPVGPCDGDASAGVACREERCGIRRDLLPPRVPLARA